MGISEMVQMEGGALESDGKKWVIAGIPLRAPLKRINTCVLEKGMENEEETCLMKCAESEKEGCPTKYAANEEEDCSTTPTAKEARIPERFLCPPAPRKRKSSSRCNFSGVREFFSPPDLDSVFIRRVERAK